MWNNWYVSASDTTQHIIDWVGKVADGAAGGYLRCVVFMCHGYVDEKTHTGGYGLSIGADSILRKHTPLFTAWKGKVDNIILLACNTAQISEPGTAGDGDGNLLCCEIAKNSGAYVLASTETQWLTNGECWFGEGKDQIGDFEGLLLRYEPAKGTVDWSYRYGKDWFSSPKPPIYARPATTASVSPTASASQAASISTDAPSPMAARQLVMQGRSYLAGNADAFDDLQAWYCRQTGEAWRGARCSTQSTDDPMVLAFGMKRYLESSGASEVDALVRAGTASRTWQSDRDGGDGVG